MAPGYVHLILELLLLTRADLQYGVKKSKGKYADIRREAMEFIYSMWFEELCLAVNLNPEAVREKLLEQSKQPMLQMR